MTDRIWVVGYLEVLETEGKFIAQQERNYSKRASAERVAEELRLSMPWHKWRVRAFVPEDDIKKVVASQYGNTKICDACYAALSDSILGKTKEKVKRK